MSFLDEIVDAGQIKDIGSRFKIVVLDNLLFSIVGYQKIIAFSDTAISLAVSKHERIELVGVGFCIKQLSKSEIIISGRIGGISFD